MGAHQHSYNFSEQFNFSGKAKILSIVGIIIGIAVVAYGFLSGNSERTFLNLLLMSYYFTCVCAAGLFFLAIQFVAQAGWSAALLRVPQSFARVLPFASIVLVIIVAAGLFSHNLYHWNSPEEAANFSSSKAFYLTPLFFLSRLVIFLTAYSVLGMVITKLSTNEDLHGGLSSYKKSIKYSAIFLVIFGFTTPLWAFDTIMSLEAEWFSTMFGWYNFAAMWVSGLAAITVTLILLKKAGYLGWINDNHFHNLGQFVFGFSIFWTYIWFAQFLLIYYANMPEETVYFYKRLEGFYMPLFWLNLIINFMSPVLILMSRDAKRKTNMLLVVCIILLCGHWLDYYIMIMPGTLGEAAGFGIIEIGTIIGFVGLFAFSVLTSLSKVSLAPKNHPFLEESLNHHI
ncbi:MAG: quinol:cytochrome C oxidoreductase [Bacteroidetes bacterium]|nr:quinol:cytochrome C oxidoreductase [Bacteroidota bacterium]MBU1372423.1 quinol:cytochrome C oxidoreductase [Bacteroidota bacterium]MBU1483447.1 quinol:cytochrome C oxidoreductase [Bacteroidota bacterium]MBU1760089.1 quinol:cytochrome C oxidoreductase [Bacteroidota bacterium]MBU2269207.1 quinol:cytochrome C oxidoreductase [Bacteroidota bacterium]